MKRIGLTGGVGSGKSTVAKIFESYKIPIVDADQLARKLREPGGAAEAPILKRFGTTDRLKLREILTRDPDAKRALESILHPLIHEASTKKFAQLEKAQPTAPFILYEAALLIEAERAKDFAALVYVTSPEQERVQRIMARDQCTEDQAKSLIRAQLADEVKLALAAKSAGPKPIEIIKIENNGTKEDLQKKVRKILDQLTQS